MNYFLKAKKLYKYMFGLFVFSLVYSMLLSIIPLISSLKDLVVGLPALVGLGIGPVGLFYILKSYQESHTTSVDSFTLGLSVLFLGTISSIHFRFYEILVVGVCIISTAENMVDLNYF